MTYIYDILLNFHEFLYDFYDWNQSDNITHIRKIPMIRTSTFNLEKVRNNVVEIDQQFLRQILNKTEVFLNKKVEHRKYICLISDGLEIIAINIDDNGICNFKSKMLIDEEIETLEIVKTLKLADININIIKSKRINLYRTRQEQIIKEKILKELQKLRKENKEEILEYIYYECTGKKGKYSNIVIENIIKMIEQNNKKSIKRINNILNLISVNK